MLSRPPAPFRALVYVLSAALVIGAHVVFAQHALAIIA